MNVDCNSSLRGLPFLESVDNVQNVENIKVHGNCYFRSVLKTETERLESLCDEWRNIQSTTLDLPPDVSDLIEVAVGMTKLLTKNFRQFKGLVHMCENGPKEDEKPVMCSDLDGFWDMMYMEVENLDCRLKNLNDLKSNNWVEKVPEERKKKKTKKTKPRVLQNGRKKYKKLQHLQ
ncbi:hypothetical protein C0J52_16154 [Blattella germanica]|nr:hypothetical protein C0J52_16154 [Blattella germanica]